MGFFMKNIVFNIYLGTGQQQDVGNLLFIEKLFIKNAMLSWGKVSNGVTTTIGMVFTIFQLYNLLCTSICLLFKIKINSNAIIKQKFWHSLLHHLKLILSQPQSLPSCLLWPPLSSSTQNRKTTLVHNCPAAFKSHRDRWGTTIPI